MNQECLALVTTNLLKLKNFLISGEGCIETRLVKRASIIPGTCVEIRTVPLMSTMPDNEGNIRIMDCIYDPDQDPTMSYMDYRTLDLLTDIGVTTETLIDQRLWPANHTGKSSGILYLANRGLNRILHNACYSHFWKVLGRNPADTMPFSTALLPNLAIVESQFDHALTTGIVTIPVWWSMLDVHFDCHLNEQNKMALDESRCYVFKDVTINVKTQGWSAAA